MLKKLFSLFILVALFGWCCTKDGTSSDSLSSGSGQGGSLARFTIAANHLYIADESRLSVFDISNPTDPQEMEVMFLGWGVETIYSFEDKLFIGTNTGMKVFSISNPAKPTFITEASHARSCDPVVANGRTAYVTLRGGTACGPATDGLYIYDITDISKPVQKSLLEISTPHGLGLVNKTVFVTRLKNGLSVVDVSNPSRPKVKYTRKDAPEYLDVIPVDNLLICYVNTGLLLYDITNVDNIVKVGQIQY